MSWVATVLVSFGFGDGEALNAFSDWLEHDAPWNGPSEPPDATGVGFLLPLTDGAARWGGYKQPEARVWGGAMNHADVDALVWKFGQMPWKYPGSVQLLIKDQEQSYFRLWMIRDGAPQQFAPGLDPSDDMCM